MCHFVAGLCCEEGAIRHSGGYLEQVMQSHRTTFPHTVFTGGWLHFIPATVSPGMLCLSTGDGGDRKAISLAL